MSSSSPSPKSSTTTDDEKNGNAVVGENLLDRISFQNMDLPEPPEFVQSSTSSSGAAVVVVAAAANRSPLMMTTTTTMNRTSFETMDLPEPPEFVQSSTSSSGAAAVVVAAATNRSPLATTTKPTFTAVPTKHRMIGGPAVVPGAMAVGPTATATSTTTATSTSPIPSRSFPSKERMVGGPAVVPGAMAVGQTATATTSTTTTASSATATFSSSPPPTKQRMVGGPAVVPGVMAMGPSVVEESVMVPVVATAAASAVASFNPTSSLGGGGGKSIMRVTRRAQRAASMTPGAVSVPGDASVILEGPSAVDHNGNNVPMSPCGGGTGGRGATYGSSGGIDKSQLRVTRRTQGTTLSPGAGMSPGASASAAAVAMAGPPVVDSDGNDVPVLAATGGGGGGFDKSTMRVTRRAQQAAAAAGLMTPGATNVVDSAKVSLPGPSVITLDNNEGQTAGRLSSFVPGAESVGPPVVNEEVAMTTHATAAAVAASVSSHAPVTTSRDSTTINIQDGNGTSSSTAALDRKIAAYSQSMASSEFLANNATVTYPQSSARTSHGSGDGGRARISGSGEINTTDANRPVLGMHTYPSDGSRIGDETKDDKKPIWYLGCCICVMVMIGVIVGVVVGVLGGGNDDKDSKEDESILTPPVGTGGNGTTSTPTAIDPKVLIEWVNLFQEYSTDVTSLTSPQHEAVEWLALIHKSYTAVDVSSLDVSDTLLQLYVLAVLNFSSKSVIGDANWKVDPTWLPDDEVVGETPPGIVCRWAGVTCNDAFQITRLELGTCLFVCVCVCVSVCVCLCL
jgi:hypothetical protein